MKIIAYNVEFARSATPDELATFLKHQNPDVICFSEVPNGEWSKLVAKKIGMKYCHVGKIASANHEEKYSDKTGRYYGKYKSILSRTPLVETDEKLLDGIGWSPVSVVLAHTVVCGQRMLIGSLHVPSGIKEPQKSCSAHLAKLMDLYKEENIIVCGDFNDLVNSTPMQALYKKGFKNSWISSDYDLKNVKTCNLRNGEDFGVIDHILYRGKLRNIGASIIKIESLLSDHCAITAEFSME